MKKVCAITMARNDEFFLNRWIKYYGEELGEENLFIYLDGTDQPVPANAGKANVIHCERISGQVVSAEKKRLSFLSDVAAKLLNTYDIVIGADADEFLVVDPACGKKLADYLSSINIRSSVSGLGMDVAQKPDEESILDEGKMFLEQRSFAHVSPKYTKASVLSRPVRWGSGFHRIKCRNYHIDPHLYLFHFGSVDTEMIKMRFQDQDRIQTGRKKHIQKRARTIEIIAENKIRRSEKLLRLARILQTYFRKVYAWNKPTMLGWTLIVRIPERFKSIV